MNGTSAVGVKGAAHGAGVRVGDGQRWAAPRADTRSRLRVAQVELLLSSMPSIVAGTLFGACTMAGFILWMTDRHALAWWLLVGMGGVSVMRHAHMRRLRADPTTSANVEARIVQLTLLCGASGAVWGVFAYFATGTGDAMVTLGTIMTLAGFVASAIAFTSHFRRMFVLYLALIALPVIVRFALLESDGMRWLAFMFGFYCFMSLLISTVSANAVIRSLELRFENVDLLERLAAQMRRADLAREEVEAASRAKSVFLSAASHDLRQPLHSLRMLSTALSSRMSRHAAGDEARAVDGALVARMDESVHALGRLFDAILDVSKLDAGMLESRPVDVRLDTVLARVERDHGPPARVRGLQFVVDSTDVVVRTDPVLLERLLGNLVGNAVRYTPRGTVRVGVRDDGDGPVDVSVSDTGIGIPAHQHEHVFEEFVQLGNPERDRDRGIGLGLAIVRRLAGLLRIELTMESTPGEGTRFALCMQRGDVAAVARAAGATSFFGIGPDGRVERWAGEGAGDFDDLFVVVVDDERQVRDATATLLESWGCTCVAVGSAPEALEVLDEIGRAPDAIVSDYRLRGEETGSDVVAALRERVGACVPALLITGDVAPQRLVGLRRSGLPVLHKPVAPEALAAALLAAVRAAPPVQSPAA